MKIIRLGSTVALSWFFASGVALACPVCFSTTDPQVARGSNLAILALLGTTFGVLGAFAAFFIHLKRRSQLMPDPVAPEPGYESQGGKS